VKKVKILGIGNQGKFNYLIFEKNLDFFEFLDSVLWKAFEIQDDSIIRKEYINKKDKFVRQKKNITHFIDKYERFQNKKARIEIFYGKKKIFMSVYTSSPNRRKFMKILENNCIWQKPKAI
jgi:hypothetical protein